MNVDFTRRVIASGKPGPNLCRDVPNGCTDGKDTVFVTYAMSILHKSDVFAESYIMKSTDGGQTFSEPNKLTVPTHHDNGVRFSFRDCVYYYNKKHDKWLTKWQNTFFCCGQIPACLQGKRSEMCSECS